LRKLIAILLILSLILTVAGCGKKEEWVEYSPTYTATEMEAGTVVLGCSELGAFAMNHVAQSYAAMQPKNTVEVKTMLHEDIIEAFINKEVDLLVSSYGSDQKQDDRIVAAYGENQVLSVRIGSDAYAVVVNAQNTAVTDLTKTELTGLFTAGEYGQDVTWSQLRPEWPTEKVNRYGLPKGEALMGYFKELILGNKDLEDYAEKENSAEVLAAVAADPNGIAVLSLSTCLQGAEGAKLLPIDSGRGPIEPTLQNITGTGTIMGLYSEYSFPIFVYVSRTTMDEKPQVFDYLWYVLSESGIRITAQEYQFLPLTDDFYANQIDIIANRTNGK